MLSRFFIPGFQTSHKITKTLSFFLVTLCFSGIKFKKDGYFLLLTLLLIPYKLTKILLMAC